MNAQNSGCDHQRIDDFLNSDHVGLDNPDLVDHLDSCAACRAYMERQAAEPESWSKAAELLQPTELDRASTAEYSAATVCYEHREQPAALQNVLDSLAPSDDPRRLGRLGSYEVSGVVGVGGMGVVLKAIDPSLDRVVAIKVMAPHLANNTTARKRFSREAKAAAAVLHPNVIPIHCVSSDQAVPYLVMAYIRGGSLQKRLEREGPLPTVEILRIGSQIAAGLAAAHEQGLVHRDIKPENILLEEGVERVTLTDFGLARAVDDASVTREGTIAGTPQYMSPEQARGESVDQKSDLFSLGSVLYALCTGRPPFRADSSYGVMRRISDSAPTPIRELNSDVPDWLAGIIERLMGKEKAKRFESASEVHEILDACLSHVQQPDAAQLPSQLLTETKPAKQPPKRRTLVAVALAGLLSAFAAAVVYYIQTNNGTVRVEVTDDSLEVVINDRNITVKDGNKEPLKIRAGKHNLIVRQGDSDFEFETDSFQIRRDDDIAFKVELLAGGVVVSKDGERFAAKALPSVDGHTSGESSQAQNKAVTADEIVHRLAKVHGDLTPKLQTMFSQAAGIPNSQWSSLQRDPAGATDAIKGEPLSLVLWKLNPLQESTKNLLVLKDFRYIGGVPKPAQLSDAMSPSKVHGYHSMLQPEYIDGLTYSVTAGPLNSATLSGNFRFHSPNLYAGKINFLVHVDADTDLRVAEFILPNYGIRLFRGEDGLWQRGVTAELATETSDVSQSSKHEMAANTIRALSQILDAHKVRHGRYPTSEEGWNALSKMLKKVPLDPWGNTFGYEFPPTQGGERTKPNVWSWGPDERTNTEDDIGSWKLPPTEQSSGSSDGRPDDSGPIRQIAGLLDAWKVLPDSSQEPELLAQKVSGLHAELRKQLTPNTESSRQTSAKLALLCWPHLSDTIPQPMAQSLADLTKPDTGIRMSDRLAEAGRPTEPLSWDVQAVHALALARAGKTEEALRENQALMKKIEVNVQKGRLPNLQLEFLGTTRSQKSLLKQALLQKALILAITGKTAESVDASTAAGRIEVDNPTEGDQSAIQAMLRMLAKAHKSISPEDMPDAMKP